MANTVQGSPAWFSARRGKMTASNFGAAAGVNPYVSRKKKAKEMLEPEEPLVNIPACTWGNQNERNALKDYMIRTGNVVATKGFVLHPHYSWLGGSPDGLVGERGMIEIKCPYAKMVPHLRIPPWYYCQVNGLMEIFNRDWCDFVSWTPQEMKIYRVYRDPILWSYLLDRYTVFYSYMKRGCDIPRMAKGEKEEVLAAIAASDSHSRYDWWEALEPGALKGRWESPPYDASSDEEVDGTSPVRKRMRVISEESPTDGTT